MDRDGPMALPGMEGEGLGPVRTFTAPEAMGMRFHEVRAKSALNRVPGGAYGFNWTVNPYRGCSHACVYCFARPTHTYLGFDAGRDFDREIVVKVNVPEVLKAELKRPSWKRELVALGTNTDPYQWVESRYRLTREWLLALEEPANPASGLTKSPLVLSYLVIFRRMTGKVKIQVNLSVLELDDGQIFVGNSDGVLRFFSQRWQRIDMPGAGAARSLALGADGQCYVGG